MGRHQQEDIPVSPAGPAGRPAPVSRRSVLRTAAGASAASLVAGGALGALPAAAATRPARRATASNGPAGHSPAGHSPAGHSPAGSAAATGRVVVHVRDASTGEMDVFAGTSHTRLRDPALAARLTGSVR